MNRSVKNWEDSQIVEEEYVSRPNDIVIGTREKVVGTNEMEDEGHWPLHCKKCEGSFANEKELKRHIKNVHAVKKRKRDFCDKRIPKMLIKKHGKEHGFVVRLVNGSKDTENHSEEVISEVRPSKDVDGEVISEVRPSMDSDGEVISELRPSMDSDTEVISELTPSMDSDTEVISELTPSMDSDGEVISEVNSSMDSDAEVISELTPSMDSDGEVISEVNSSMDSDAEVISELTPSMDSDGEVISELTPSMDSDTEVISEVTPSMDSDGEVISELTPSMDSDGEVISEVNPSIDSDGDQNGILLDSSEVNIIDFDSESKIMCTLCDEEIPTMLLEDHVQEHNSILTPESGSEECENISEEVISAVMSLVNSEGNQVLLDSSEVKIIDLRAKTTIPCPFCDEIMPTTLLKDHLQEEHNIILTPESGSEECENISEEMDSEVIRLVDSERNQVLLDSSEVEIRDLHAETTTTCSFYDESLPTTLLEDHVEEEHCFISPENESEGTENKPEEVISEVMSLVDSEENQVLLDSSEVKIRDLRAETTTPCNFFDESLPTTLLQDRLEEEHNIILTPESGSEECENISEEMDSEVMPSVDLEGDQNGILLDSSEVDIVDLDLETKTMCELCDERIPTSLYLKHLKKAHSIILIVEHKSELCGDILKEVISKMILLMDLDGDQNGNLLDSSEVDITDLDQETKSMCTFCDERIPTRLYQKHLKKAHGIIRIVENESELRGDISEEMDSEVMPSVDLDGDQNGILLDSTNLNTKDLHPESKIMCEICDKIMPKRLLKKHAKKVHHLILTFENESDKSENNSGERRLWRKSSVDSDGDESEILLDSNKLDIKNVHPSKKIRCTFCNKRIPMRLIKKHGKEHGFVVRLVNGSKDTENHSEEVRSEVKPSVDSEGNQVLLDTSEVAIRDLPAENKIAFTFRDESIPTTLLEKQVKEEHCYISRENESEETKNKPEEVRSEVMPFVNSGGDQESLDTSEVAIRDLPAENTIAFTFCDESIPKTLLEKQVKEEHCYISRENESEETKNKPEEVRSEVMPFVNSGGDQESLDTSEVAIRDRMANGKVPGETTIPCTFCDESILTTLIEKHVEEEHCFIPPENESEESKNKPEEVRSVVMRLVDSEGNQVLLDSSDVEIRDLHAVTNIPCSFCDESIPTTLLDDHVKEKHCFIPPEKKPEETKNKPEEVRSKVKSSPVDLGGDQELLDTSEVPIRDLPAENTIAFTFCDESIPTTLLEKQVKEEHCYISPEKKPEETKNKPEEVRSEVMPFVNSGGDQDLLNPFAIFRKVEKKKPRSERKNNVNLNSQGVECEICQHRYSNELNLKKHIYNVHKMARVKCQVCDKEVNKKSLNRHMKSVHSARADARRERKSIPEGEKPQCSVCNKKCMNLRSLKYHVKNVHEVEKLKCTQCDFQGTLKRMERHMNKKHNDEVYQCPKCQKILKSKATLKEHMCTHSDYRRFVCDICGMRFKRTSNYHGHMKSHEGKQFQCQICGNFFLRRRYLALHEQTIHNHFGDGVPREDPRCLCDVCGVTLKWKNNISTHKRLHSGVKPYKCKVCGNDFASRGSLTFHMSKHDVCPEPDEESNLFIQQSYFDGRVESTVPFFAIPGDSLMQFISLSNSKE